MASITKRGHKQWRARVRKKGFPTQTATFDTKAEAEAWARDIEARMHRREWIDTSIADSTTLAAAIQKYIEEKTPTKKNGQRSPETIKKEENRLKLIKTRDIAKRTLGELQDHHFAEYRDQQLAAGYSPYTVNNEMILLSHIFTVARKEWGMKGLPNPLEDVDRPDLPQGRDRRMVGDEEARLLAAAAAYSPEMEAAVTVALESPRRAGELARLTWADIDFKTRIMRLGKTKNGSRLEAPLSPRAIRALKKLQTAQAPRENDPRVFRMRPDSMSTAFAAIRKAAKITDLRLHDIRHEGTSRLIEAGVFNLEEVRAQTGHKTLIMLQRYSHPRAELLAEKLAQLQKPKKPRRKKPTSAPTPSDQE